MNVRALAFATLLLALAVPSPARAQATTRCDALSQLSLPGTAVTLARVVAPGAFVPAGEPRGDADAAARREPYANLPAFCRVALAARPSSDSDIRIEVWLPQSGWNGRFQAVGEGGLAGSIPQCTH